MTYGTLSNRHFAYNLRCGSNLSQIPPPVEEFPLHSGNPQPQCRLSGDSVAKLFLNVRGAILMRRRAILRNNDSSKSTYSFECCAAGEATEFCNTIPPIADIARHRLECLLWVKSRHLRQVTRMSALPPKADINPHGLECLLCARNGHLAFLNIHRNVAHRDAGGGTVHSINSGCCLALSFEATGATSRLA